MAAFAIIHVTPLIQPVEGECPSCHFDSLERVTLSSISSNGVGTLADQIMCSRCDNE